MVAKTRKTVAKKSAEKPVKPAITLADLPQNIQNLVLEKAGGDVTRISIVSHTEIVIHNGKD